MNRDGPPRRVGGTSPFPAGPARAAVSPPAEPRLRGRSRRLGWRSRRVSRRSLGGHRASSTTWLRLAGSTKPSTSWASRSGRTTTTAGACAMPRARPPGRGTWRGWRSRLEDRHTAHVADDVHRGAGGVVVGRVLAEEEHDDLLVRERVPPGRARRNDLCGGDRAASARGLGGLCCLRPWPWPRRPASSAAGLDGLPPSPRPAAPSRRRGLGAAGLALARFGAGCTTAACETGSAAVSRAPRAARKVAAMSIAPTRVRSSGRETAIRALSDAGGRMFSRLRAVRGTRARRAARLITSIGGSRPVHSRPGCAHPGAQDLQAVHHPAPGRLGPFGQRSVRCRHRRDRPPWRRIDRRPDRGASSPLAVAAPPSQPDARAIYEQVRRTQPARPRGAQISRASASARSGVRLSTDTSRRARL